MSFWLYKFHKRRRDGTHSLMSVSINFMLLITLLAMAIGLLLPLLGQFLRP